MRKVRAEERLDGKYLLSTSDDSLSPEDVALGYKQLLQVERAFRTLKTTLELRPVHHRKEDRIRSHVLLCWLALHLVRVAERETGETWDTIRSVMDRIHLGEFCGKDGGVLQRTELTQDQQNLLKKLKIPPPPLFRKIAATPETCRHTPKSAKPWNHRKNITITMSAHLPLSNPGSRVYHAFCGVDPVEGRGHGNGSRRRSRSPRRRSAR
jgi:hypothetical protein